LQNLEGRWRASNSAAATEQYQNNAGRKENS
jgi:hypothetical protein